MASLLVGGRLGWVAGELVEDPAVVFEGSRVVYAGPGGGAPEADKEVSGDWFLAPGAVDHHVHVGLSDPSAILAGGVTLVRDLAWPAEEVFPMVDISTATEFDGPQVVAVGPMITVTGGYPSRAGWCPPGGWTEVRGAEEAANAVARLAAYDPAAIKVALNEEAGPTLSDAELVAVCDAAHGRGLQVTAHVQGRGQTERALGAGVDELAHCPWSERLGEDVVAALARHVTIVSTLDIHSYGRPTPELAVAVDNLRRFAADGGRVRYGTDLGNGPIPPGIHVGEAFHLAAAGLSADRILELLAGGPGLIGMDGDPRTDLQALGRVKLVIREGRVRRLDR
jgi:imidazolonepropionase-like amidohydrolase